MMAEDRDLSPQVWELLTVIRDALAVPRAAAGDPVAHDDRRALTIERAVIVEFHLSHLLAVASPELRALRLESVLSCLRTIGTDLPVNYAVRQDTGE